MKNKPIRHKEDNKFKFLPFSERIANIDVDIFHRISHPNEEQSEELESYFYQTLQKWSVLNLTESFEAFKKEVFGIITLPQLLHKKDYLVEVLIKHLKFKNILCLQPLLELVVALAKDLRKEFYEYYQQFLHILIELLNIKNDEIIEWTFTCLAFIFKYLWKHLIKDIDVVFINLLPLLSDTKPSYINNFAAESFAFVARKVKDKSAFLALVLESVEAKQDGIVGCGKLLFETIKGISGSFHSCAENTLLFYFESLSNENVPQNTLFRVMEQVIRNIIQNIHPKNSEIFWKSLISVTDKNFEKYSEKNSEILENLLKLIIFALELKQGRFLNNSELLINQYTKMIISKNLPENILLNLSKICSQILVSKNIQTSQENCSFLIRKTLIVEHKSVKLDFVENLIDYSAFEPLILPVFLKKFSDNLDFESLELLMKIVLKKSSICQNGISLSEWKKYPLDFGANSGKIVTYLLNFILFDNIEELSIKNFIFSLIIIPHISFLNYKEISKQLSKIISIFQEKIKTNLENYSEYNLKKLIFSLINVVECFIHISDETSSYEELRDLIPTFLVLAQNPLYTVCCLRAVDLIITALENTDFISYENLKIINENLGKFVSSPFHEVRLLITHIYSIFDNISELNNSSEKWNVFTLCYATEKTEPLVHNYRDHIQNLSKLAFDKPQGMICQRSEFNLFPLRYFLGALYVNFQLLWDPLMKLIEGYAHGMVVDSFWEIFIQELRTGSENVKNPPKFELCTFDNDDGLLKKLFDNFCDVGNEPDYGNYRILLWKSMNLFSDVVEMKNRDVADLMLSFIEEEYKKNNVFEALTWNIKQNDASTTEEIIENDDKEEKEEDDDDEDTIIQEELNQRVPYSGKFILKMLSTSLRVFSQMKNPRSIYRENELNNFYLDLLSHKSPEIQKLALECILTYKQKFLTSYKENLLGLIDEKSFKNQLLLFKIDKETSVVDPDHRQNLIPIVLRLVYSKMLSKTGLRTGGKSSGQLRRNLILRFLSGCHETEMLQFIEMSFRSYKTFLQENPEEIFPKISENIDFEKFFHPKRLQSSLNLLQIVLHQFGGLMSDDILKYLLKILVTIGSFGLTALGNKNLVHPGYFTLLKNIKSSSQLILVKFFERFERYPWSPQEITALFDVLVWPYLDKLPVEGIHSPTPILKLFSQFAKNPRYFVLLVKHHKDDAEKYALAHVVKLLIVPKINASVVKTILEMIENLLTLKPEEENEVPEIFVDNILPLPEKVSDNPNLKENLNYGSCILLPFVPQILEKFQKKLSNKSKSLLPRELFIMSRISELVFEPTMCDVVLNLVLPMVVRKAGENVSGETMSRMVQTIFNLMKTVENPNKHLRNLAPLFGEITSVLTRKMLCDILKTISEKSEENNEEKKSEEIEQNETMLSSRNEENLTLSAKSDQEIASNSVKSNQQKTKIAKNLEALLTTSKIICKLNAFSKKHLDQPDFEKRLSSYREINELIVSNNMTFDLGAIIIHNCFYTIRHESDLALKESSRTCLLSILPHLLQNFPKNREYLMNEIVFVLIRKGIKSKNEDFRKDSIMLLGFLARECSEYNFVLKDLNLFTCKADLEVDFFENLLHLQLYRQTKALNKFNQIAKQLITPLNVKSCINFILPLVSSFLLKEEFAQKNSLIDSSIEAVKTVCQMLPWNHYESILKFYLFQLRKKLDFQRQLVRLVVAILDAYHFDLSQADSFKNTDQAPIDHDLDKNEELTEKTAEDPDTISLDSLENLPEDSEPTPSVPSVPFVKQLSILNPTMAKKVLFSIRTVLLPQLNKAMAEMTLYEQAHKLNRKKTGIDREEQELQKVPISLAVVKLLQKLPEQILERNLPRVFLKTCTFLKSHLDSVRRATREILQKIMGSLGPKYLPLLISEMITLLSRGFQVHVLVYTIHSVLVSLKTTFQPNDIDKCLKTILDVCKLDLFGNLAEEKEVQKITRKVSEAKSTKSYDSFQILAQFITEKCLTDLIVPLKEVLKHSHSHKIVTKVQECLRNIVLGLVENNFISTESLLIFSYGISSENIPELFDKNQEASKPESEKIREKTDCFIIAKLPVYKTGYRLNNVRNSSKSNSHLLVEFGLRLCYFIMKREKIKSADYVKYIDPFIDVFKNCLTSRHVKMCTLTAHCLSWTLKHQLPSLEQNISDITTSLFEILHKYSTTSSKSGDNHELALAAFKTTAILVRDAKFHTITTEQLKILLLYVEENLINVDKQSTAFALLKAIISRKLIVPEMYGVLNRVAELSIVSESANVRLVCRQICLQFIMDYPLGKKLDKYLSFFVNQLGYEMKFGRESALEIIFGFITHFPEEILQQQAGMFFVMLGARLVNDESPECRKMVAKCLQTLLEKLDKQNRDILFDIVLKWFEDKKINHQRLASQICGIFISCEKANFHSRLPILTPKIKTLISPFSNDDTPGKFVRISAPKDADSTEIQPRDHQLFQLLQMLLKICVHCPEFLTQTEDIEEIAQHVQGLLAYPHQWVRIASAQFLGYVLNSINIEELSETLKSEKTDQRGFLFTDPKSQLRALTLDLLAQLNPDSLEAETVEQIIKNLLFISRVIQSNSDKNLNLLWLIKRVRKIINKEVLHPSKTTLLRTETFKLFAGIVTTIDKQNLEPICPQLLAPIVRELSMEDCDKQLYKLCREISNLVRQTIGHDKYMELISQLQVQLNIKRAERKRQRVQLAVTDPDVAAKKKIKVQEKKKLAKKRKMEEIRGKRLMKKRRKVVNLDDSEVG